MSNIQTENYKEAKLETEEEINEVQDEIEFAKLVRNIPMSKVVTILNEEFSGDELVELSIELADNRRIINWLKGKKEELENKGLIPTIEELLMEITKNKKNI